MTNLSNGIKSKLILARRTPRRDLLENAHSAFIEHVSVEFPCEEELFESLKEIFQEREFFQFVEYGDFLADISMIRFAFTTMQMEQLKTIAISVFPELSIENNRLQVCVFVMNTVTPEKAARLFLTMLDEAQTRSTPRAELIWELNSLLVNPQVQPHTKSDIRREIAAVTRLGLR